MFRNRKFNIELKYYKFPLCFRRYVDVVEVLIDSIDASAYWRKLKQRLKQEGNGLVFYGAGNNCQTDEFWKLEMEEGEYEGW